MILEALIVPLQLDKKQFNLGIDSAVNGFKVAAAGLAAAGAAFVGIATLAANATFKWADELDSIQDIMGGTSKNAAALNFVLRKSKTSTDALTKGMTILEKGLVKADGTLDAVGKSLKEFGIDVKDVNGNMKDQGDLLNEISHRYNQFGTQQERVNFLTEVFGRSGADLIDFFDTLAADGGIDAVTRKIEALGLAIDPNRYEQFNRSIEELKLIGLSLAVAFTERVMPVLENFVSILTNPDLTAGQRIGQIADAIDQWLGGILDSLATGVEDWTASGGPDRLVQALINIVTGATSDPVLATETGKAGKRLIEALVNAFKAAPWGDLGKVLKEKFGKEMEALGLTPEQAKALADAAPAIAGITVALTALVGPLKTIAGAGGLAGVALIFARIGSVALTLVPALNQLVGVVYGLTGSWEVAAIATNTAFVALSGGAVLAGVILEKYHQQIIAFVDGGLVSLRKWEKDSFSIMQGWAADFGNALNAGLQAVDDALDAFRDGALDTKLREIGKKFYTRAAGWVQQAIAGFTGQTGVLIKTVSSLVASINAELRRIITSFHISVTMGGIAGVSGTASLGGGGSGGGHQGRATGGPGVVGQTYRWKERGQEFFVPKVEGDFIPANKMNNEVTLSSKSISDLARELGIIIPTATVRAMNNA